MPGDGPGKRVRAETSHEGWTDSGDTHRRVTAQMPQQQWGGQQPAVSPPAAGQPGGGPTEASPTTVRAAIGIGVVLLFIGLLTVFSLLPVGLAFAGAGVCLVWWAFVRIRR